MVDAKRLLDTVVGALAKGGSGASGGGGMLGQILSQAVGGLKQGAGQLDRATGSVGAGVNQAASGVVSEAGRRAGAGDLMGTAREMAGRPEAQAALAGVAGLLLSSRRGRGIVRDAAAVGGLALIGGLAFSALQNFRSGRPLLDAGAAPAAPEGATRALDPFPGLEPPAPAARTGAVTGAGGGAATPTGSAGAFAGQAGDAGGVERSTGAPPSGGVPAAGPVSDAARVSDDDALLFVRAMVAAAAADGQLDAAERARIVGGMEQAGLDADATSWLDRELAAPADVEELAAGITNPDKAAQIYAAARIAIDPDTLQEREFLRRLQAALDLDDDLVRHIDAAAASVRAE